MSPKRFPITATRAMSPPFEALLPTEKPQSNSTPPCASLVYGNRLCAKRFAMSSISASTIPSAPNFEFRDSSFFQNHNELPLPHEVRLQARTQYPNHPRENPPATFESMGLFVKWGDRTTIAEGQALAAIYRYTGNAVPSPEIYGWRTDRDDVFLYMQAINGATLEQAWPAIVEDDRFRLCQELRTILDTMRLLRQDPNGTFIGNVTGGPLYDRSIHPGYMAEAGPFKTVQAFNDWFAALCTRQVPDPETLPPDPFRKDLPDNSDIVLTHGDLHPSNIIISTQPCRVLAIVDWEQSGWLPAYWESCKTHFNACSGDEWSTRYLPMILDQHPSTRDAWQWYTSSMGC